MKAQPEPLPIVDGNALVGDISPKITEVPACETLSFSTRLPPLELCSQRTGAAVPAISKHTP